MTLLGLQLHDMAAVLAFRRICVTKKKEFSSKWGKVPWIFGMHNVCASHARQMCERHVVTKTRNDLQ